MRKTRILASLVCIMMVVCSLPMMASAAEETYDTVEACLGLDGVIAAQDFQFVTDLYSGISGVTVPDSASIDSQNGMILPTGSTWGYTPSSGYTVMSETAFVFGVQVPANGKATIQANAPSGSTGRARVSITSTSAAVYLGSTWTPATNEFEFVPGSDYAEYLMAANSEGGYSVYVKHATQTSGKWKLLAKTDSYKTGSATNGVDIVGEGTTGCVVKYATVYRECGAKYDSIQDIIGNYTTTYNYDFDENSKTNMLYGSTGITYSDVNETVWDAVGNGSYEYTENGWTGSNIRFNPQGSGWGPLTDTTCFSVKAKGSIKSRGYGVGGYQLFVNLGYKPGFYKLNGTATYYGESTLDALTLGDEWVEYLFVKNGNGFVIYVKSEKLDGDKWVKVVSTDGCRDSKSASNAGIQFNMTKDTAYIKNIKVYDFSAANVVADENAKPAGETVLLYSDDFDAKPTYPNLYAQSGTNPLEYADGNMVLRENDLKAEIFAENVSIPIGGYAEYRIQPGDTAPYVYFYEGTHYFSVMNRVDYCYVPGKVIPVSDGSSNYRTIRVARTAENTYNVYCRADGDTHWYAVTGLTGTQGSSSDFTKFRGAKSYAGTEGVAKIDYLRVYVPAATISEPLTITDGYSTAVVGDNSNITFENGLRAIVTEETGKLLVVSYKGDDMLKAQIVNVADMVNDSAILNATADGATKVKVFLWDSFSGLNRKTPAVTLNL